MTLSILPFITLILSLTFLPPINNSSNTDKVTFNETESIVVFNNLESYSDKPDFVVFDKAWQGYTELKKQLRVGNKNILTIIDFSVSSKEKRMWVIDLEKEKILYHILVAHGKNTGEEFAQNFSNTPNTKMSSLGFFITGNTYYGKHGLSLYLDGMEKEFNDNARTRNIVIHGAEYVSSAYIKKYGRLGRSFGCPAISINKYKEVIHLLANKTCLFIYFPETNYLKHSTLLNLDA
ncbi:murein L,D-transpeptidase catalytic domain family protein [Draconibacterium mangrovi]|uniref:murein L,D-transpeptidase catalytic domain family protein n=1 Tax=Draconibacterium mangrovi TaxID=2697469 RepID=UPI0013D769F4|nr:murein L,D-transpeptidase catalytic domain family protein [Draconibacterium mangrovi]